MRSLALFLFATIPAAAAVTVAADGTGQFKTVQEAVDAAPANSRAVFEIRIRPGVYKERVAIPHNKPLLRFLGEDARTTVITDDLYAALPGPDGQPLGTFRTPTVSIAADDFMAENITFENSAGPKGQAGQGVALAILGDRAVFRKCRFLGWQDTLLAQTGRQYFVDSYIEGAVDFIFGGSAAFFENCHIHVKGNGYITAASTPRDQKYGYVFSHCRITGESPAVNTDLGRPWRDYGAVIFLDTEMAGNIRPAGWNNWSQPAREKTARYAEYGSTGPGANPQARVSWARQLAGDDARAITIEEVLGGTDGWNPQAGTIVNRLRIEPATGQAPNPKPRDPSVAQGRDKRFYRVTAAGDLSLRFEQSKDANRWSELGRAEVMANRDAINVQSPSLFYHEAGREFVITWASTIRQNFFQSYQEPLEDNPRIWYSVTKDFVDFAPAQVLFDPGYAVRDAVIVREGTRYALLHQDSRRAIQQLRVTFGLSPTGPWGPSSGTFPERAASRPSIVRSGDRWLIAYLTGSGIEGYLTTQDFLSFRDYDKKF
jgi:pectinesterase